MFPVEVATANYDNQNFHPSLLSTATLKLDFSFLLSSFVALMPTIFLFSVLRDFGLSLYDGSYNPYVSDFAHAL